jgi:HD-GYP domain-containing protein (c-di-GMP phosphodiesterase class II)
VAEYLRDRPEMGLSEDRSGIRMAGLLHDIGKIYVPSEILARPDG